MIGVCLTRQLCRTYAATNADLSTKSFSGEVDAGGGKGTAPALPPMYVRLR